MITGKEMPYQPEPENSGENEPTDNRAGKAESLSAKCSHNSERGLIQFDIAIYKLECNGFRQEI
jgi:hypothetical protein